MIPEKAALKRAPGTSFIWAKINAVLSRNLSSWASFQSSWPSRVLSPIPVKTESPEWFLINEFISSWTTTVLPTPAPPRRPTFPPFGIGRSKSITLTPVERISVAIIFWNPSFSVCEASMISALCSETIGFVAESYGLPSRSMILPRTGFPTGTVIPFPSVETVLPIAIPSIFVNV